MNVDEKKTTVDNEVSTALFTGVLNTIIHITMWL